MPEALTKYEKRVQLWRNRAPQKSRRLRDLLVAELMPAMEAAHFDHVDCEFGRADQLVIGAEIRFERAAGEYIDVVDVFFDKYAGPSFQISISRRMKIDPSEFVRSAHVVSRPSEYYHEWGKPWWWPSQLWSDALSRRTVKRLLPGLGQISPFLESGARGPNISRAVMGKVRASGTSTPPKSG